MRGEGASRGCSLDNTCSGKRRIGCCKVNGNLDNFVIIDIDSDEVDDVIIIDVPESLQQKLRGSSVLRKGKRFPCIISIDDEDESNNVDLPEINVKSSVNLDDSDDSSTKSSPACDAMPTAVHLGPDDCLATREKISAFKLSKCRKIHTNESCSRNRYGLNSESEDDLSESSSSDCEVMEGSVGDLHKQWEKASLKKKSRMHNRTGVDNQGSPCCSPSDMHPNVEVGYKQNSEAFVSSSSESEDSLEKTGPKVDQEIFSGWKNRLHDNADSHEQADVHSKAESCKGNGCVDDKSHCTNGHMSFQNAMKGPCSQLRPNLHPDCEKAGVNDRVFSYKGSCSGETEDVAFALNKKDEECTQAPSCSNSERCGCAGSNKKETPVYGGKFMSGAASSDEMDVEIENVASRPVEVSKTPSHGAPRVIDEKSVQQYMASAECGERSSYRTHCEGILNRPGTSKSVEKSVEKKGQFSGFVPNIQRNTEYQLSMPLNEVIHSSVRDIINEREKLKETDEYKRAIEQEWAERQRQLQIQAEEAQRLRKRKKAQTLRILDMEKRLKQRVEEVRETQKKDEENLNTKERLRVEIREELRKLEITCINMASLLHGLGIRVEGGSNPSSHELHAAYKRALLKFHPDRASRTDIRQQVEAEEKFKLISRMKEKFLSASCH